MLPEHLRLVEAQRCGLAVRAGGSDSSELVRFHDAEADAGVVLDLLLKLLGELFVAFGRDHGQRVDLEAAQALAVLVHAKAQTTSDRLASLLLGSHLPQGADLEDVRVVPAFAQCGVGEDELQRRVEAQQLLLVAHDQAVGVVVCLGRALGVFEYLHRLVADPLLVDREIAVVYSLGGRSQIHFLKQALVIRMFGEAAVFLLKDAGVVALHRIAVGIVVPVLLDGIDEEQAEHLDALRTEALLLIQVLLDSAVDHLALHGQRLHVAVGLAGTKILLRRRDSGVP